MSCLLLNLSKNSRDRREFRSCCRGCRFPFDCAAGSEVCASDIALQTVGVTAVNCFAGGRFVFIGGVRCVVEMGAVAGVKTRARAVVW